MYRQENVKGASLEAASLFSIYFLNSTDSSTWIKQKTFQSWNLDANDAN